MNTDATQTPRTEAFAFSEERRCHESGALIAPGDTDWLAFARQLETELAAANAQVLALREALVNARRALFNCLSPLNITAYLNDIDRALSAQPPPVVAKEVYDRDVAMLNQRLAERTQDMLARIVKIEGDLRKKVAAAEKDADDLAKSMAAVVRATRLQEPLHLPDGFPMRNWLPGEWPLMEDARAMVKALAAHEARKPKPVPLASHLGLPADSFAKFIEENAHKLP